VIQMASRGVAQCPKPRSAVQDLPPSVDDGIALGPRLPCFAAQNGSASMRIDAALISRAFPSSCGNAALDPGPRHHTPSGGGARPLFQRASPAWAESRRRSSGTAR